MVEQLERRRHVKPGEATSQDSQRLLRRLVNRIRAFLCPANIDEGGEFVTAREAPAYQVTFRPNEQLLHLLV